MGLNVKIDPGLPVHETVMACNIETREVVRLLTGEMVHAYKFGDTVMVSEELYEELKEKAKDENIENRVHRWGEIYIAPQYI